MTKTMKGALLASAVCSLFATGAMAEGKDKAGGDVKCSGINSCKGTGSCAGAHSSCKGQNSCKGEGWTATKTAAECTSKGGKVVAAK